MSSSRTRPRALVTGASAGIGAAYAGRLAREGYDLVLVARRRERLEQLAERLHTEAHAHAEVLAADLADAGALAQVEARVAGDESLALLVNNAGFGAYRPFAQVEPAVIDSLINVHVRAVARLTRAALPGMIRRGTGGVINVASLLAFSGSIPPNPLPHRATYAGAKAFIVTFTQALAGEISGTGVRVQVCLPGVVATEFHTVQGMDFSQRPRMTADDVVAASLAALAQGEVTCVPALDDASLLERLLELQRALMGSASNPVLAKRYRPDTA
ncbi:MAG TPA: SDR family NAD(P)-dependent oxidoreductase [bacterium]|nr:SDR family NAD(P)-dependent oxidoreductase [bacterium]